MTVFPERGQYGGSAHSLAPRSRHWPPRNGHLTLMARTRRTPLPLWIYALRRGSPPPESFRSLLRAKRAQYFARPHVPGVVRRRPFRVSGESLAQRGIIVELAQRIGQGCDI